MTLSTRVFPVAFFPTRRLTSPREIPSNFHSWDVPSHSVYFTDCNRILTPYFRRKVFPAVLPYYTAQRLCLERPFLRFVCLLRVQTVASFALVHPDLPQPHQTPSVRLRPQSQRSCSIL